jgi:hypothetical protein
MFAIVGTYDMEAMLNTGGVDVKVSSDGVWDKICLAFPILGSNVRASYMLAEKFRHVLVLYKLK